VVIIQTIKQTTGSKLSKITKEEVCLSKWQMYFN